MGLSNVNIILGNGNIGSVSMSDDGIAGLIVTGNTVTETKKEEGKPDVTVTKLELGKRYVLGSTDDLSKLGIDKENNPLAYKEVMAFYAQAGNGAELHLMVVAESVKEKTMEGESEVEVDVETTLLTMCANEGTSPINMLIKGAGGRIRMIGINRNYTIKEGGESRLKEEMISAIELAQTVANKYAEQVWPVRVFLPAIGWTAEPMYKPNDGSYNRVGLVLCSDGPLAENEKEYSAAIGQVLGRAAGIPVHHSIARVRDGAIAVKGYLMDGQEPEQHSSLWNTLNDNGYIFYRTFIGKNGYYLNDDPMCVTTMDDYAYLNLGRVIDKAIIIAYKTYIEDLMDNVLIDEKGQLPTPICKSFEAAINRSVNTNMGDEISSFSSYVNPAQDVLTTGRLDISCKIVPQAILREINVNLSFSNPTTTTK